MVRAPLIKLSLIIRSSLSPINSMRNPSSANKMYLTSLFTRQASHTFRTFSSSSNGNLPKMQDIEVSSQTENEEDVDKAELKSRINKFYEGDMDAIPSIFEAILKRKLTGKHDDSDNELVDELRQKYPGEIDHEEFFDESDSDFDSDSDSEGP